MDNPSPQPAPLSIDEFRKFADLLVQLLGRYKGSRLAEVTKAVGALSAPRSDPTERISGASSFNRYILGIENYLEANSSSLITAHKAPPSTKPAHINPKMTWIRDFWHDLQTCFVDPNKEEENGRAVLVGFDPLARTLTKTFTAYFWYLHYHETEKTLTGYTIEGSLFIYGDWVEARLEYRQPDDSPVAYTCAIDIRADAKFRTFYLPLKQIIQTDSNNKENIGKKRKQVEVGNQADELMVVLTVVNGNPILAGTFAGAVRGYPVIRLWGGQCSLSMSRL